MDGLMMIAAMAAFAISCYAAFHASLHIAKKPLKVLVTIVVVGGGLAICATAIKNSYDVDQDENRIFHIETTLWGLSETRTELKWRAGTEGGPPAWCARGVDGKWYPYFTDYELPTEDQQ